MRVRDNADTFGGVSIVNHWMLAAVMIALLLSGFVIGELLADDSAVRSAIIHPHKAVGVLLTAWVVWMLAWWRIQPSRPGPMPGAAGWEAAARKAMHGFLIVGTAVLILSGVVMSLFSDHAIDVFGLFVIPSQGEVGWLAGPAHAIHEIGGWIMLGAVAAHALVAVKHHLVDRDPTLARMTGRGA